MPQEKESPGRLGEKSGKAGTERSLLLAGWGGFLAGILLFSSGLWRTTGADLQLLPLILLAAGVSLLVFSWRGFDRGR